MDKKRSGNKHGAGKKPESPSVAGKARAEANKARSKGKGNKLVVLQEFRDVVDFDKVHEVGESADNFEESRLDELVQLNLVGEAAEDVPAAEEDVPATEEEEPVEED